MLLDPMLRVRVTLTGLEYRVVESRGSCVMPPSDEALRRNPESILPVPAGHDPGGHSSGRGAVSGRHRRGDNLEAIVDLMRCAGGVSLDSSAQLGIRAVKVKHPYLAAVKLQNTFRGFKHRRAWLDLLEAERKKKALVLAQEKQRQKMLQEDIENAEKARAAAETMKGDGPSAAAQFRGRHTEALRATVVTAEANERKKFAELQYEPTNVRA